MDKLRRTIILSIISIGLFAVIGAVLPGISAFDPIDKSLSDISVTDIFYAAERDNSPVENDRFLIIDTSDSDRGEIARAVSLASEAGAAVVAVDIIFSDAAADSSATAALCKAMASNRGLTVSAIHLNEWDDASQSYISTLSTATDSLNLDPGYTNFMTGGDYSYIRNYSVAAAGSVPSFAQATADRYRSIYGDDSPMRPTDTGIIDFSPQAFDIVDAADIAAIDSLASGRMVLLGATDSDEDYHFTPIGRMSGVEIQAYSIDTILSNPSVVAPQWAVWLICVILVMASSAGFVMMRDNFESRNPTANRYTYAVLGQHHLSDRHHPHGHHGRRAAVSYAVGLPAASRHHRVARFHPRVLRPADDQPRHPVAPLRHNCVGDNPCRYPGQCRHDKGRSYRDIQSARQKLSL